MEKVNGVVDEAHNLIVMKETMSTIKNVVSVSLVGQVVTSTRESTETKKGKDMEKCIGLMAAVIKGSGLEVSNMAMVG
jgi:hypothetical protein